MNVARIYLGSSRAAVLPCAGIENKLEHCKVGEDKTRCSSVWWGNRKRAVQGSGIEKKGAALQGGET